jgi:hypothetical protein
MRRLLSKQKRGNVMGTLLPTTTTSSYYEHYYQPVLTYYRTAPHSQLTTVAPRDHPLTLHSTHMYAAPRPTRARVHAFTCAF